MNKYYLSLSNRKINVTWVSNYSYSNNQTPCFSKIELVPFPEHGSYVKKTSIEAMGFIDPLGKIKIKL